ncbi:hypothetical protein JXA59_01365 [Patescibacteria group bacterium]|nr:hypothetical protein [Patescibacteria group bacterium]
MRRAWWWIIPLSLIIGLTAYLFTDRSDQWEASAVYTIAPKTSGDDLAYTDIQASNLFIDVVRSWLLSNSVRLELSQNFLGSRVGNMPHRSMQTFDLQVIGSTADTAIQGLVWLDSWLQQEVARYNQSGQMTQYSVYSGEITQKQINPHPDVNGFLAGLITLMFSLLITLFINYYRQAYAHRH